MAAVLFTILKILGITLLVLLAIAVILILIVLFVPIKYLYKFSYNDEIQDDNCHFVDVSWIFRFIKVRIYISMSGVDFEVRICGIRCRFIEDILYNKSDREKNDDIENTDDECDEYMNFSEIFDDEETLDGLLESKTDEEIMDESNEIYYLDEDNLHHKAHKFVFKRRNRVKEILNVLNPRNWLKIVAKKVRNICYKVLLRIKGILKKGVELIKELINSIKSLINKITLITEFLERPSTIKGIEKLKEYIGITFKHVLPTKKELALTFGLDNPADTGQILAVAGIMYPLVGDFVCLTPNFEDKELKVNMYLKGRIRGINVVIIVIKVMRDKAIKRLIHNINKLKEEL